MRNAKLRKQIDVPELPELTQENVDNLEDVTGTVNPSKVSFGGGGGGESGVLKDWTTTTQSGDFDLLDGVDTGDDLAGVTIEIARLTRIIEGPNVIPPFINVSLLGVSIYRQASSYGSAYNMTMTSSSTPLLNRSSANYICVEATIKLNQFNVAGKSFYTLHSKSSGVSGQANGDASQIRLSVCEARQNANSAEGVNAGVMLNFGSYPHEITYRVVKH